MRILLLSFIVFICSTGRAQVIYSDSFTKERLRYDYVIAGNSEYSCIYDQQFTREPYWGGSTINLIDTFRYGELLVEVSDSATGKLLYSRGYSSLFKDWQLTKEAKLKERAFTESLVIPFPKQAIEIVVFERDSLLYFQHLHSSYLNPQLSGIRACNRREGIVVHDLLNSGPSSNKVDIAIIGEGYTTSEMIVFVEEAKKSMETFFEWQPYKNYRDNFNFYAVFVPSDESGTDIPRDTVWRHTALNSNFYTFECERYLTIPDMICMREFVSEVPYDHVCVMVNTKKYGGGGVYNSFTVFSAKNELSGFLFLHEFGHAFAGLADEYYTSPIAYEDSVSTTVEPYQPNVTTRVNFQDKWEDMIPDTIPVPTPNCETYAGTVGLFEGAMYKAKGVYRPAFDCAMKSKTYTSFCPVCRRAIERMIRFNCAE